VKPWPQSLLVEHEVLHVRAVAQPKPPGHAVGVLPEAQLPAPSHFEYIVTTPFEQLPACEQAVPAA
jgi:hypothetical protein